MKAIITIALLGYRNIIYIGSHFVAQAGLRLKHFFNLLSAGMSGIPHHAWLCSNFVDHVLRNEFQKPATQQRYVTGRPISAFGGLGEWRRWSCKASVCVLPASVRTCCRMPLTILFIKQCYLGLFCVSLQLEWLRNMLVDTIFTTFQLSRCLLKHHSYFHCAPQQDIELKVVRLWKPYVSGLFPPSHAG